jgi:hypothetical protein
MILLFLYLAGMCEGFMDTISFHYKRFEVKHPKANKFFWDASISWGNKYDENFKPKFFLSTTVLVFLTDGWHLFKFLRNIFIFTGIYFCLDLWYIAPLAYLANRLGFTIVYNWFYK